MEWIKISLTIQKTENQVAETFYGLLNLSPNENWKLDDSWGNPTIFFYEEEEHNDLVLQGDEEEYNPDEETEDHDENTWQKDIYQARLQKASEWLLARQSALQQCCELGMKPYIHVQVVSTDEDFELPAHFVAACGQVGLSIRLYFRG